MEINRLRQTRAQIDNSSRLCYFVLVTPRHFCCGIIQNVIIIRLNKRVEQPVDRRENINIMSKIKLLHRIREKLEPAYLIFCLISFLILDLSFRYIYSFVFSGGIFSLRAVIFTVSWSVLLTSIIGLLPRMIKRIFMMLLIVFMGVLVITHAAMFHIFHNFFSFADIMYAGDGARFFSFYYLRIRKLLIISVLFSIAIMGFAAWAAPKKMKNKKIGLPVLAALLLISAAAIFATHSNLMDEGRREQMSWASAIRDQSDSSLYIDFTNVNQSMAISGLYQYTARNLIVSTGLEQWLQTSSIHKKLDEQFLERQQSGYNTENEMTGRLAGKNVIMIMMESIDSWMVTEEYMPNLYAVAQDSVQFVNHYSHLFINAATFNTEFMAMTGLIPPTAGIRQSAYKTNDFSYSLPSLFRNQGYRADSFHSSEAVIYDRGAIHRNIGFSSYNCWWQMGMSDPKMDSQLVNGYDKMTASEPFFDFIITFSGHGPYNEEFAAISEPHYERAVAAANSNGITGSEENLKEYYHAVAHAMETDAFVGGLIERLEADGRIENTVLVFFTDHYSKYFSDTSFVMDIKDVDTLDLLSNTPFFIYSKDLAPQKITKYTSSIDIFPTIVNLFALDADLSYFIGDDAFGGNGNYVMFRNYAWYDGETYYSADYQGELTEEMAARTDEVKKRINLSWNTLTSDYFAYLQNK